MKIKTLQDYLKSNVSLEVLKTKVFSHKFPNKSPELIYQLMNFSKNNDTIEINDGSNIYSVNLKNHFKDEEINLESGKILIGIQKAIKSLESGELDEDMFRFY